MGAFGWHGERSRTSCCRSRGRGFWQSEQFVSGVPARPQDGVDVDVVAGLGPGVEGADLVGDGVVGVQYRADGEPSGGCARQSMPSSTLAVAPAVGSVTWSRAKPGLLIVTETRARRLRTPRSRRRAHRGIGPRLRWW